MQGGGQYIIYGCVRHSDSQGMEQVYIDIVKIYYRNILASNWYFISHGHTVWIRLRKIGKLLNFQAFPLLEQSVQDFPVAWAFRRSESSMFSTRSFRPHFLINDAEGASAPSPSSHTEDVRRLLLLNKVANTALHFQPRVLYHSRFHLILLHHCIHSLYLSLYILQAGRVKTSSAQFRTFSEMQAEFENHKQKKSKLKHEIAELQKACISSADVHNLDLKIKEYAIFKSGVDARLAGIRIWISKSFLHRVPPPLLLFIL